MRFKGTFIFVFIVAAVVGFAIYDYQNKQKEDSIKETSEHILPNYDFDKLKKVEFRGPGGSFEFELKEGKWFSVKPVEDRADDSGLRSFVEGMSRRVARTVEVEGGVDWSKYGLDKPEVTIQLTSQEGNIAKIELGTVRTFDDGFYIRKNGDKNLYAAEREWASDIQRVHTDFRNKEIWLHGAETNRVKWTHQGQGFEFHKREEKWVDLKKTNLELDQRAVEDAVNLVRLLKVDAIQAEDQSATNKSKYGLVSPAGRLEIDYRDGDETKTFRAYFSAVKNGDVFLYTDDAKPIYKVMDTKLLGLKKSANDLRSKEQPFKLSLADVDSIRVWRPKNDKKEILLNRSQDSAKIDAFLSVIKGLRVGQFKSNVAHKKISYISALDKNGKEIFSMDWGLEFKDSADVFVSMKTSNLNEVFLMRKSDLETVDKYELVTPPTPTPAPNDPKAALDTQELLNIKKDE